MKLVCIESPYKGKNWEETEENLRFGRLCMHDSIENHDEAPYASHLLYTQPGVLDDKVLAKRKKGMKCGFEWKACAHSSVVYINRGISVGMHDGVKVSINIKQEFEYRILPNYPNLFPRPSICTITGASGVGKTLITRKLFDIRSGIRLVTSFTDRSARKSDLPNEYRYNVSAEKFEKQKNRFLWVVSAHGNNYGTHKNSIAAALWPMAKTPQPRFMILVPEAVSKLRDYLSKRVEDYESKIVSFYILSPDEEEIRLRLAGRGDDEESIRRRIKDCRDWDNAALQSDIPYIFLQNNEICNGANNAAKQMSLFF